MKVVLKPNEIVAYQIRINIDLPDAHSELQYHKTEMSDIGFECSEVYQIPYWSAYAGHLAFDAKIMKGREIPHLEKLAAWDRKFEPVKRLKT